MDDVSVHALACDLIGDERAVERARRPTLRQAASRVSAGEVMAARRGQRKFCVARLHDGRLLAVPDRCPHDGGLLSDGFVDGNRLVCARHGWEFDLTTGACPMREGVAVEVLELGQRRRP